MSFDPFPASKKKERMDKRDKSIETEIVTEIERRRGKEIN